MTYKNIFLSMLVVPLAIVGNSPHERIEQLKKDRFEKELELSALGKIVTAQQELIESMWLKSESIMSRIGDRLNDEEIDDIINKEMHDFRKRLKENLTIKDERTSFLNSELGCGEQSRNRDYLGIIKIFMIRYDIESDILKKSIELYEKCLKELFKITNEIDELQK